MNSELIKEVFRNLENTFIGRLRAIEDILVAVKPSEVVATTAATTTATTVDLAPVENKINEALGYIKSVEDYTMGEVRTIVYNADKLEERVSFLEKELAKLTLAQEASTKLQLSLSTKLEALLMKEKEDDDRPVEAVEAEVEIEAAEAEALNSDQEGEQEEGEQEEGEQEEGEQEEGEQGVEPFEYKYLDKKTKKLITITLYHDTEGNAYREDEEGGIDPTVIGHYDPKTKKFTKI